VSISISHEININSLPRKATYCVWQNLVVFNLRERGLSQTAARLKAKQAARDFNGSSRKNLLRVGTTRAPNFKLTRIPKQEWGARASRVQVRASRPNFRHTRFREFPEGKSLPDDVFGATPKTTRPRRVLPETHHCVRFQLRNSG
jgi:hypothetical protein